MKLTRVKKVCKDKARQIYKILNNHKNKVIILVIIIACIYSLFLVFESYLNVQLILGNDLIISVGDRQNYFNVNQAENVTLSVNFGVNSNIFCKKTCDITLTRLKDEAVIYSDNLDIIGQDEVSVDYQIITPVKGRGIELYNFEIVCNSNPNIICKSSGKPVRASKIYIIEYDLSIENKKIQNVTKSRIMNTSLVIQKIRQLIEAINKRSEVLNSNGIDTDQINIELNKSIVKLKEYGSLLNQSAKQWFYEEFQEANNILNSVEDDIIETQSDLNNLMIIQTDYADENNKASGLLDSFLGELNNLTYNSNLIQDKHEIDQLINDTNIIIKYISLEKNTTDRLTKLRNFISSKSKQISSLHNDIESNLKNLTASLESSYSDVCKAKNETCVFIDSLNNSNISICDKLERVKNITEEYNINASITSCWNKTDKSVTKNLNNIIFKDMGFELIPIQIEPSKEKCCLKGECDVCCHNQEDNESLYPVIMVHGHLFNGDLLVEYSLNAFSDYQLLFDEQEGYIDGGLVGPYLSPNSLNGVCNPVVFRASYYIDAFTNEKGIQIMQKPKESLESYAVRIKEVIDQVLVATGKKKADIVTHSMGGLVIRRYVQLFGDSKINKIIMIASPNKGIEGDIAKLCGLGKENIECRDMTKGSIFINKLNQGKLPSNIYNIYGSGCNMQGEDGDGIVKIKNAFLNQSTDIKITGYCSGLDILHNSLIDPKTHPEVFDKVNKILAE